MTQRDGKMFSFILLSVLSFFPTFPAQIASCIKYETYQATQYKMEPLGSSDAWFSHSFRYSPRRLTKIGLRSKRLFGCCDSGYQYQGYPSYSCQPFCFGGCSLNSHCSAPNQCSCDNGYHRNDGGFLCIPNEHSTPPGPLVETTITPAVQTTSLKVPCNGSCQSNEFCSLSDDICTCQNGFQRINGTSKCVPMCENGCQNADCTSPNICTCWPHYVPTNDSSCHLKCSDLSCAFGECNIKGTCVCAQGFFNNGSNYCIWAGDDMLSEPDYCECWSKFSWQRNVTESHCRSLCDGDDSIELTSECIPIKECEFYEGYIICHSEMFKCIDLPALSTTTVTSFKADKVTETKDTSMGITLLIVGSITIILVVGAGLLIWQKRRSWFNQLWSYNTMQNTQEEEEI